MRFIFFDIVIKCITALIIISIVQASDIKPLSFTNNQKIITAAASFSVIVKRLCYHDKEN
jgi:hypothetical protein